MVTPDVSASTASAACGNAPQFERGGACIKRGDKMPVLDIVTERFETDFRGVKADLRRADEPPGVVHHADFTQRRGVRQARLPHSERFQRRDRTGEQRRGAMIRPAGGAISSVSTPAAASANALTRPAGPPPITATSAVNLPLALLNAVPTSLQQGLASPSL